MAIHTILIRGRYVENYLQTYDGDIKYIGDDFFSNL